MDSISAHDGAMDPAIPQRYLSTVNRRVPDYAANDEDARQPPTASAQPHFRAIVLCAFSDKKLESSPLAQPRCPALVNVWPRICHPGSHLPLAVTNLNRRTYSRSWLALFLKWAVVVYCSISVLLFSVDLHKRTWNKDGRASQLSHDKDISVFTNFTTAHLLSKLSSLGLIWQDFEPYVIHPSEPFGSHRTVSACIWTADTNELKLLPAWATTWQGPVSLLLVTNVKPNSIAHAGLLRKLQELKNIASLSKLSLHLLHISNRTSALPNAYLNLARLFSQSSSVMLIPHNFSFLPLVSHRTVVSRVLADPSSPLVLPPSGASPLLHTLPSIALPQKYPIWCTERFFFSTRELGWQQCLWQLSMSVLCEFESLDAQGKEHTAPKFTPIDDMTRARYVTRFRAEICESAVRVLLASGMKRNGSFRKKLSWLKQTCVQFPTERFIGKVKGSRYAKDT